MAVKHHRPTDLKVDGLDLDYNKFAQEIGAASFALGELQASQAELKNPSLLVTPLTAKEAEVSSRIEGTVSTVSDVFQFEAGAKPDSVNDTKQVANYRKAMRWAFAELKKGRPISQSLVKAMHSILLDGVRHRGLLGDFRKAAVWIGENEDDPIEKALYIPPEPWLVNDYMENLFAYLKDGKEQALVKAGIAHYQFEAVHPFGDGNGRVGRLLVPLIICAEGQLTNPILYLSGYFEAHRSQYVQALRNTDKTQDLSLWIKFFLGSVATQLQDTQALINKIKDLHKRMRQEFSLSKSPYAVPFIEFLFEYPSFTVPHAHRKLKADSLTIRNLIREFSSRGFVREIPGVRIGHAKLYNFEPLIKLL